MEGLTKKSKRVLHILLIGLLLLTGYGCGSSASVAAGTGSSSGSDSGSGAAGGSDTTPTISTISNVTTPRSTTQSINVITINFTVSPGSLECSSTYLSMVSSDTTIIPNANVSWSGTAPNCTATITPTSNAVGSTTITIVVAKESLSASTAFTLTMTNTAPTISTITDKTTPKSTAKAVSFTIADSEDSLSCAGSLSMTSSNTNIVPKANVVWSGTAPNCTATITPTSTVGTTTITITASDGLLTGSKNFVLTTTNSAPTISDSADTSTAKLAAKAVAFTIADSEDTLTCAGSVSGSSSSTGVVPTANIVITGTAPNCTATITPTSFTGTATITLTATDGALTASDSFVLTVTNSAPTISGISETAPSTARPTAKTVTFTIADAEDSITCANVTATSGTTTVIANSNTVVTGAAQSCTLTMTPTATTNTGTTQITLSVTDGALTTTNSSITLTVNCPTTVTTLTVAAVYPTNGPDWNDYVGNNGSNFYGATDAACDASTATSASSCLHAGEVRKVNVPAETSCTNLSISDSLGAFNWTCVDSGANVVYYSSGLKTSKRLADLIDWTTASATMWKANTVTVTKVGCSLYDTSGQTAPTTSTSNYWGWTNDFQDLGDLSTSPPTGGWAKKIYTLAADATTSAQFGPTVDKVAIVVKDGVTWTNSSTDQKIIYFNPGGSTSSNYHWLESGTGVFTRTNGDNSTESIYLRSAKFSVLRKIRVKNADTIGVYLLAAKYNRLYDVMVANSELEGMKLGSGVDSTTTTGNILSRITVVNSSTRGSSNSGIFMAADSSLNTLTDALVVNGKSNGIALQSNQNTLSHITIGNNGGNGLNLLLSSQNTAAQTIVANNGGHGLALFVNCDGNQFANLAAHNNATDEIYFLPNSTTNDNNLFLNNLLLGSGHVGCTITDGTGNKLSGNGTTCSVANSGTETLDTTSTVNNYFVGQVANTVDTSNTHGSSLDGSNLFAYVPPITDWFKFNNVFRAWGMGGNSDPMNSANRGACTSGSCGIWDWRVKATSNAMRDINNSGIAFPSGGACPVNGNNTTADLQTSVNTFVTDALEILGDGLGDDDGLCESNEACIYSPNMGVYQGESTLSTCNFTNGTVTGVTMYGYATNGG